MIRHALDYAGRGFRVFPLNRKVPRTANGFYDATLDRRQLTEWWTRWPDADIGIRTGDGLAVLDVDGAPGHESLGQLEDEHGILRTLTARTGGGGLHLYLTVDGDIPTRPRFRDGLDLKARGGYVVAPPSGHASGRRYEWVPDHPEAPQPMPVWLSDVLNPPRQLSRQREVVSLATRSPRYVMAAIEAECSAVASAAQGERNHTLNAAAFALARFVAAGEADAGAVQNALHTAAHHAGLPDYEINRTIRSAFRARRAA